MKYFVYRIYRSVFWSKSTGLWMLLMRFHLLQKDIIIAGINAGKPREKTRSVLGIHATDLWSAPTSQISIQLEICVEIESKTPKTWSICIMCHETRFTFLIDHLGALIWIHKRPMNLCSHWPGIILGSASNGRVSLSSHLSIGFTTIHDDK